MIGYLILLVLVGLVVGALGRLAVPGPNPMSIPVTILVGVAASLVAGLVGRALIGRPFGILISVLLAAGIVFLMQRSSLGAKYGGGRSV